MGGGEWGGWGEVGGRGVGIGGVDDGKGGWGWRLVYSHGGGSEGSGGEARGGGGGGGGGGVQ